ncbi:MAG: hypothetical protein ACNA7E_06590 [Wenzhouxiangellaceae bacterium]
MKRVVRMPLQVLAWAGFGLLIAAFSAGPRFSPLSADQAQLTLALAHLTDRVEPCRQLSEAERQALPPTRRVSEICERARRHLAIELSLDQELLYREILAPGGLHGDGRIYRIEQWPVSAGTWQLRLRLAEPTDVPGVRHEQVHDVFDGPESQAVSFDFTAEPGASIVLEVEDQSIRLRHAADAAPVEAP